MKIIEVYSLVSFAEYINSLAVAELTDKEYELDFQGLFINDQCRYLQNKGVNIEPIANQNGIYL